MAESVIVWVRTSALDKVVHGKSTTSSKRAIPGADSDDSANLNWGWARCSVVADEGSKGSSAAGLPPEGKPVKVFVQDEESEHNRSTLELPPNVAKDGDLVMANIYSGDDEEDEDEYNSDGEGGEPGSCFPDDLITLTHLHEPAVVYCLRRRYAFDKIYTATGPILLALNPFKNCRSMYSESVMKQYFARGERSMLMSSAREDDDDDDEEEKKSDENAVELGDDEVLPPHVYGIADHSFRSMMMRLDETSGGGGGGGRGRGKSKDAKGCDQAILVSGESGAGKTVTTKFIMQYLATLSTRSAGGTKKSTKSTGDKKSIEQQVLQSNPILESFGNARTIRNDNSSRFGKFIEIQFTKTGSLVGACIDTYLLEKVRLITQAEGERNYHIFYELLQGMDDDDIDRYFLDEYSAEDFRMTSNSGTYDRRDGVDDCDTFQDLMSAMATMGFDDSEQVNIMTVTCAILHFSNVVFKSLSADESEIDKDNAHLEPVLSLLGVTYEDLNRALCYFSITAGKEKHQRSLSKEKAEKGTDALIKATYGALFTHIVARVNSSITVKDGNSKRGSRGPSKAASIGVLDIFGFESFKHNSFEQLCINYCNEALQQQFNLFVLKNEQDEYEREGIKWSFISFPDNQDVLDLIHKKGAGILNILDDQCRAPGTTDKTFANDIYQKLTNHERFSANFRQVGALKFGVHHYAGPVEYETAGFVEKNRDELPKEATDLLLSSKNDFVKKLAGIISGGGGAAEKSASSPAPKGRRSGGAGTRVTVGGQFAKQLGELRAKIDLTSPHYVRCLKPNDQLVPDLFDPVIVSDQLRCAGVVEAVRVSRVGYPQRYTHSMFVNRYRILGLRALKLAARGSKKAKPVEVLVNHIAAKIMEDEGIGSTPAEGDKKSGTAASKKKGASGPKPSVDLVAVGMQVGKTKVFLRRKAFDTIERMRNQFMRESAIRIQAVARRYVAMREFVSDQKSILMLQCMVRRIIASQAVQKVRENFNAKVIQTAYRRRTSRSSYLAVLAVTRWLQKSNRGRVGRMRYETLNRGRKSKILQKYWRRHSRKSWYESAKTSSLLLQCALRCYWARMVLKDLRSNARNLQATATERDELKKETQELRKMLDLARKQAKIEAEKAAAAAAEAAKSNSKDAEKAEKLEEEMKILKDKLTGVEQDAQQKALEIDEAKAKASQIEQELDATKEEKSELASRLEKIAEEAESKEKSIEELKDDLERIQNELKDAQESAAENAATSDEIETLKEKVEELQQELETAANNEEDPEVFEEIENLNAQNEELRQELEEAKKRAEEAEAKSNEEVPEVSVVDSAELTSALSEMEELKEKLRLAEKRAAEEAERADKAESLSHRVELPADLPPTNLPPVTPPRSASPSEPETAAPNEEMALEVLTLQDEVQRLNRELADAKSNTVVVPNTSGDTSRGSRGVSVGNATPSTGNFDNDIISRYEELRKLAEAGIQKDKEIDDLKREVEVLRDELEAVETSQSQGSSSNLPDGVLYEASEPKDYSQSVRSIPDEGEFSDHVSRDEMHALRDVNEMLRKELEITQRVAQESKVKLKEETERSAMELEAFAETLRSVDDLRKAAEVMSRELTKTKRRERSQSADGDDPADEAKDSFREASRALDGSGFKEEDFWSKLTSTLLNGGNLPKNGHDTFSRGVSSRNIGELPSKVKGSKKRRARRRNSGDSSIVSSFF